ncbi:MAG: S1C family serine protease, partial [Alphaproteobacteria bacterium]
VITSNNQVMPAELVGADPVLDLAVLRLPSAESRVPAAKLGDSADLEVGQDVLAVGNVLGMGLALTRGIVSGLDRVVRRSPMSWLAPLIQTDAAINAGSSGGPLVNLCGEVVGINTFRLEQGDGVAFSVPVNIAEQTIPQLIEDGRIKRPWHGINGKIIDVPLQMLLRVPLVRGLLVEAVEPGSAAAQIGLRGGGFPVRVGAKEYLLGGDIITHVNGERLIDLKTAARIVGSLKVGDSVEIEFFREGKSHTAEAILPERPVLASDLTGLRTRQADYQRRSSVER